MITTASPSFYLIKSTGEAAELLTSLISSSSMLDITAAIIVSKEFDNDIEPINELDIAVQTIKAGFKSSNVELAEEFNPLYYPCTDEEIDSALDVELKGDNIVFNAMNGNPFHAKRIEVTSSGVTSIEGLVIFKNFDLPGYESIMEGRALPLN